MKSISNRLLSELILVNELVIKHGVWSEESPTPLTIEPLWKLELKWVQFVLPCLNHIVGRFAKYIWYVVIIVILSHDITMFSCIFITLHNFKY
jgi:hypothetical protein